MEFAVVIPAYNEAATLRGIVQRVRQYGRRVIVVDDGSTDDTAATVADLPVTLIRHASIQGKAASLWDGMEAAMAQGVDAVITLDADGQHRPEDIPRFLQAAREHPGQIIIGSRLANKGAFPAKRYYANRVANFWISWAAGYAIDDSQSGFRLYPVALLRRLDARRAKAYGFVFESEILIRAARMGFYSHSLPIAAIYETRARPSHFRPVADIARITLMVAWHLTSRALYPTGFYRAFVRPWFRRLRLRSVGRDGWWTLLLSNVLILATLGTSLLWQLARVWRTARRTPSRVAECGYFLVLGVRLRGDTVGAEYARRLQRARALWEGCRDGLVVILGGSRQAGQKSEARGGYEYLLAQGLPPEAMHLEQASRHTLENLRQAREMLRALPAKPVVLISSRYHLERVRVFARGLGMDHVLCAAETALPRDPVTGLRLLREAWYLHWYYVGRGWSQFTGNARSLDRIR